jgi:hypothetical protein
MTEDDSDDSLLPLPIEPIDPVDTTNVEGKKPVIKARKGEKRDLVKEAEIAVAKDEKKKAQKKKRFGTKSKVALGVFSVIGIILYYGMQPIIGTPRYGVCRTFIELQLPYPETLQINTAEESALAVRIYFSHIDAFGSSRLNMIECEYKTDPRLGLILAAVHINRQPIPQEELTMFNFTVSYILANPPDLRLPRFRDGSLNSLKIDYY